MKGGYERRFMGREGYEGMIDLEGERGFIVYF